MTAVAREGVGVVRAELFESANAQKVYQDIRQEVDRIRTFPEDAEEPDVTLLERRRQVLTVEVYGEVGEWALRQTVEMVRDRLLSDPEMRYKLLYVAGALRIPLPLAPLTARGASSGPCRASRRAP